MVTLLLVLFDPRGTNTKNPFNPLQGYMRSYQIDPSCFIFYNKLDFCEIFSKHKRKDLDINNSLIGLIGYKLINDFGSKNLANV